MIRQMKHTEKKNIKKYNNASRKFISFILKSLGLVGLCCPKTQLQILMAQLKGLVAQLHLSLWESGNRCRGKYDMKILVVFSPVETGAVESIIRKYL